MRARPQAGALLALCCSAALLPPTATGSLARHAPVSGRIAWPSVEGAAALPHDRLVLISASAPPMVLDNATQRLSAAAGALLDPDPAERDAAAARAHSIGGDLRSAAWSGEVLYLVGSHARTPTGEAPSARYRVTSLTPAELDESAPGRAGEHLLTAIQQELPFLADALRHPPARAGLAIEAAAWSPEGNLLLGLRSPTVTESIPRPRGAQEDAVILRWLNPEVLRQGDAVPARLAPVVKLDLHGQGLRDMVYDVELRGWWLLSGLAATPGHPVSAPWHLWWWDGVESPERIGLSGVTLTAPGALTLLPTRPPSLLLLEGAPSESRFLLVPRPEQGVRRPRGGLRQPPAPSQARSGGARSIRLRNARSPA